MNLAMNRNPCVERVGVLLVAGLLAAACGGPERSAGGEGWGGTVDTLPAGRIVVVNPDPADAPAPWTLVERFRIGSLQADGPDLFGQISGLQLGPAGEVYVLDGQASEIRAFGADGVFQHAFGGEGQGPGELSSASGLAFDAHGTLWTMNWANGRYSGFDPATGAVRSEPLRAISFASFPWGGAFEQGSRLVDIGLDRNGAQALLRLDSAFVPHDTLVLPVVPPENLVAFRRGSLMIASLPDPFAPRPAWAVRPRGGVIVGDGATYRLHRVTFEGDTTMTIQLDRAAVPVSAAERDSALALFREMAESLDGVTASRKVNARATQPAHGRIFVDDQDRSWVWSMRRAGADPVWDVFDEDGRYMGSVPVPLPPSLAVVRGGRLAVATQVDGYPVVVVYDLVRSS